MARAPARIHWGRETLTNAESVSTSDDIVTDEYDEVKFLLKKQATLV